VMLIGAGLELVLAMLLFSSLAATYDMTVPLCVGIAMCLTGFTILRFALQLRHLPSDAAVTTLPLFGRRDRFVRTAPQRYLPGAAEEPAQQKPLRLRVWTPAGSIEGAQARPLLDRYIATVDRKGVISTGHAALAALARHLYQPPARRADRPLRGRVWADPAGDRGERHQGAFLGIL
jgi:hypothetical protein